MSQRQAEAFDRQIEQHEVPANAIGNEMRVFGPPGTGKTTYLGTHITLAAKHFGPRSILVMSHTRAAAHELVSLDTPIPVENIATLHSVCLRVLGKPRIAETITSRWNDQYPMFRLSKRYNDAGEPVGRESLGDQILRDINFLRARMIPVDYWPSTLRPFWAAWSAWKTTHRAADFTDLIQQCLRDKLVAPGNPSVIICDEFQDFSALQMTLVRSWAKSARYLLTAGDDDQSLYGYAGADPRAILIPQLPDSQIRILSQSRRITAAMHRYVTRHWTNRISFRQPKVFLPRAEEGIVKRENTGGFDVKGLASKLEVHIAAGRSTMLLGSAHFALKRTMAELQKRGVPYGNRFRGDQPAWNPLGTRYAGPGRKVHALISGRARRTDDSWWQGREIKSWASWLANHCWQSLEARTEALKLDSDSRPGIDWLAARFNPEAWEGLLIRIDHSDAALADWWARNSVSAHTSEAFYAARVVKSHGLAAATAKPKLTVGTIHSVKGAQADVVYVLPDLTNRWKSDYLQGGESRDALLRFFYVACTRAKHTLVLCEPWRRGSSIQLGVPA